MAFRDKVEVDTFNKGIQYALEKLAKSKFGFERTAVLNFKSRRHEGSGNELVDYSRAPCLGADQKARGLWERDCAEHFDEFLNFWKISLRTGSLRGRQKIRRASRSPNLFYFFHQVKTVKQQILRFFKDPMHSSLTFKALNFSFQIQGLSRCVRTLKLCTAVHTKCVLQVITFI